MSSNNIYDPIGSALGIEPFEYSEFNINDYEHTLVGFAFEQHTEETKSIMKIKARKRVQRGDNPLCNSQWQKEQARKRKENNQGFSNSEIQSQIYERYHKESFDNGIHIFLDPEVRKQNIKKQLENGTHPSANSELQSIKSKKAWETMPKVVCPHCGKMGAKPVMYRYHFDLCKSFTCTE